MKLRLRTRKVDGKLEVEGYFLAWRVLSGKQPVEPSWPKRAVETIRGLVAVLGIGKP